MLLLRHGLIDFNHADFHIFLGNDFSWSRLRHHCVMFVRYSELNNQEKTLTEPCLLDVYFLRHQSFFNANGYLELLKKCDGGLENILTNE